MLQRSLTVKYHVQYILITQIAYLLYVVDIMRILKNVVRILNKNNGIAKEIDKPLWV